MEFLHHGTHVSYSKDYNSGTAKSTFLSVYRYRYNLKVNRSGGIYIHSTSYEKHIFLKHFISLKCLRYLYEETLPIYENLKKQIN